MVEIEMVMEYSLLEDKALSYMFYQVILYTPKAINCR
jgi:hypothetical protein